MAAQLSPAKQSLRALWGAIRQLDESGSGKRILLKGLILLFAVMLSVSTANWVKARQELQAITAANNSLRKTLGEMAVAITKKDREIDRLGQALCGGEEKPHVARLVGR